MRKLGFPRFKHWLSVVRRPAWQYLFALPLAVVGAWIPLRDEFLPKETAEKLKIPRLFSDFMPSWLVSAPWYWWAIATLIVLIALILEGSYRVNRDSLALRSTADADKLHVSDMANSAFLPNCAPLPVATARKPLLEFIADARRAGWDTSGKTNAHIMDLLDGLRQAALDGAVAMFGRPNRNMFPQLTKNEPLNEISREHWKDYMVDVATVMGASDNFDTVTYNLRAAGDRLVGGFVDIHLGAASACAWLRDHAGEWRGRRK